MAERPTDPRSTDPRSTDPRRRVLVTPEGLVLPFTLASRGSRVAALLIDLGCMGAALLAAFLLVAFMAGGLSQVNARLRAGDAGAHAMQALFVLLVIVVFLIRNAWFIAFELGPRGATPGKRLMKIRVAARDGARLTPERVIARNLLRDIELFLPMSLLGSVLARQGDEGWLALGWFLLFALLPFFSRDRLRAGDLVAGTWVVEAPRAKLAQAMTVARRMEDYRFRDVDLAVYGEYELQRLEEVLRLAKPDSMTTVAETIAAKIGWSAPQGDQVAPFLEAYYAQLRARLEGGMRMGRRKADKHA